VNSLLKMDLKTFKHVAVIRYYEMSFHSVGVINLIITWIIVCFTTIERTFISTLIEIVEAMTD